MLLSLTKVLNLCEVLTRRHPAVREFKCAGVKLLSTSPGDSPADSRKINVEDIKTERKMSSAMRMYLKRKREHDIFISKERAEFDIGRQHLANMMGYDPDNMSQEDIDKSIEYLFPSGLSKEATPVMKPPEEIFPRQKEVEFDLEGRPFHPFFYTLKPNFNHSIFTMRDHIEGVTIFGDRLRRQGKAPDSQQVLNLAKLADSRWVSQEEMQKKCLENISENDYKEFLQVLERLVSLPFSYRVRDDIFQWRVKEEDIAAQKDFLPPQFDEKGRAWVEVEGRRKTSRATVRVSKPGTGQVEISHVDRPDLQYDISYFYALKDRHQLLFPLQFSKMLGLVDVQVTVGGGGPSGQAGAIRYGLAMALRSFVDKQTVDDMKLVGLLTQDIRVRERKKPGKVSARKNSKRKMSVYDDLILHISPDKFYVESLTASKVVLVIDRINYNVSLETNNDQIPAIASRKPIAGIIGVISLVSGPYLVVITRKARLGALSGAQGELWKIVETEIISYARSEHHLTSEQLESNRKYTEMLKQVLSTPYFYFSYNYDISHSRQRFDQLKSNEFLARSLVDRVEKRFVWNLSLLEPLVKDPSFHRYCLPIIHGFVSINQVIIAGSKLVWSIISRRSTERCGTRLFVRGGDENGWVANYVETEQIVEFNGMTASFVQTRGSIPLLWQQRPDLRYKPPPTLEQRPGVTHTDCFVRHFQEQKRLYGQQVIINLIDQKGAEGMLEQQLKNVVLTTKDPNIFYEPFDFHHECRKMRWDRLSILMDRLSQYQEQFSYFLISREGSVLAKQSGLFRTNCIDCLDRTNVVQSMLARLNLQTVLVRLGVLGENVRIENQQHFEYLFKNVWADHADMISIQYSGTGALKTDFTRTGKRTKAGVLEDGRRSVIRYFKNNFADGFRQDSLDLFVGNYAVSPTEGVTHESPIVNYKQDQRYLAYPVALALSIAMFTLSLLVPADLSTEILLGLLFWAAMIFVTGGTIFKNGLDYVDQPHLFQIPPRPNI